jgi:beta-galactosidase
MTDWRNPIYRRLDMRELLILKFAGDVRLSSTGVGWWWKHLTVRKSTKMNHLILFDGVYMNSDVWLNGHHLGNYPFGYNSFYYDLDPYLKEGENIIAVKADNSKQPNSRWYSGSGIYRHVWLIRTNKLHLAQWGIYKH